MASDGHVTPTRSPRTIRLIDSVHLQREPDGGAVVIDDRTLTAARLNQAARILVEALHEPHTEDGLATVLAEAADCAAEDAAAAVARLIAELAALGWIESTQD